MGRIDIQYFGSSFGELLLGSIQDQLCLCDWRYRKARKHVDMRIQKALNATFCEKDNDILRETRKQLNEYFSHQRRSFDLPLHMVGTPFQQRVWNRLLDIPFGRTSSYLQVAEAIGDPNAVRAVASANGANAISIIVPCHRVIGSKGSLVGYAGGLQAKADLLSLEFDLFG